MLATARSVVLLVPACADVVVRNLPGGSLPLVIAPGAITLLMIVCLQRASAVRHHRLARTEVFLHAVTARAPRAGAILRAAVDLTAAVMFALVASSTPGILARDIDSAKVFGVTDVLTVRTWPFRALVVPGLAVAAVQAALRVATGLSRPGRRGPG